MTFSWIPARLACASLLAATALVLPVRGALAQGDAQPTVKWSIDVIQDGQQVDNFAAQTTVGQSFNATHRRELTHEVGCQQKPAAQIVLSRTLNVSPLRVDPASGVVTLAIDAQETLEGNRSRQTAEGCTLPPQPRQVTAAHPGLQIQPGQAQTWQIVDKDPSLAYRISATAATAAAPAVGGPTGSAPPGGPAAASAAAGPGAAAGQ
jgi:hypothetical protein